MRSLKDAQVSSGSPPALDALRQKCHGVQGSAAASALYQPSGKRLKAQSIDSARWQMRTVFDTG